MEYQQNYQGEFHCKPSPIHLKIEFLARTVKSESVNYTISRGLSAVLSKLEVVLQMFTVRFVPCLQLFLCSTDNVATNNLV